MIKNNYCPGLQKQDTINMGDVGSMPIINQVHDEDMPVGGELQGYNI